ncbi:MAG TPA: helix-turn-helix transcriptional regulator [Acidimicrobiales bacterium]|nr:helix-turn-helix transcriptional regulator [Acidimicrobiales bacterium]
MDHPSRYPIWSLLRRARKEAGLSQRQLAALAGTSQAAIARYEKARVMPDLATLFRLLRVCGFNLRLDLQPHDDSNDVLIAENLRRTPSERAARNRSATRMRAAAAQSPVADGRRS